MWRWTGFNMGVDLIVTFDNWNLTMKRSLGSTGSQEHEALLSNHKKRHISYRVSVYSLNDQKQVGQPLVWQTFVTSLVMPKP